MIYEFIEMLNYAFMQRAFISGIFIAIACSLLGTFLVLRRYALIGDGIAHISFGGIATGLLFSINPFFSALIFSLIGAISIINIKQKLSLYGDTAIGIVSHASLGIGVFIASAAKGFNVDIMSYLFGSILVISSYEMILAIILALIVVILILLFYNELFAITFDEITAKTMGINVNLLNYVLIALTAITIVNSMKIVGLLLASALIILPSASALMLKKNFKKTLFLSAIIGTLSVIIGLMVAYLFDIATSGSIVLVSTIIFLIIVVLKKI
jgi:zinc transport system permease protein